jgi:hypothetical protein
MNPGENHRGETTMRFTRIVYWIAAAYGFVSLVPLYFLLEKVGRDAPPPITHPEFYYGFLGVTFLWQVIFVMIARNPLAYRSLIPITILEKFVYTVPVVLLYFSGSVHASIMRSSLVDPVFGILFLIAYVRTRSAEQAIAHT